MRILFLVFLVSLSLNSYANHSQESLIVDHVNQHLPQALLTLEQAVNINSGTMNFSGVKKVADIYRNEFTDLGFDTQWLDGSEFNRAGHLVAKHGDKGPKVLLIGHLDTVFAQGDKFQKFTRLENNKVSGPGITDMKGGNSVIVLALKALKSAKLLDELSITVVLTGDEESSGKPLSLSKKAIVDAAKWADIALGFEDGDGDIGTAVIARRSASSWRLTVSGKPAHSSQIFRDDIGYGAAFELARILEQFRLQLSTIENLTFNPGVMTAGTDISTPKNNQTVNVFGKNNVIAKSGMATGGIRALSNKQLIHAKQVMQLIVKNNLAHTNATLVFDEGYPPMAPTESNKALLEEYSLISQGLGYGQVIAVNPRKAGAADISFAADHVSAALDGLGVMGTGGHTNKEVANIDSLQKNAQKAAILLYQLSKRVINDD